MSYTALPAKSPGDVFSATPMWNTYLRDNLNKGVVRPIAETTLAAPAASIDFTSIAADWSQLMIIAYLRGDTAAANTQALLRLNNDSGANYDYQLLSGQGATAAASATFASTSIQVATIPANTAPANVFATGMIVIPHYAGSANHKALTAQCAGKRGTGATDLFSDMNAGFWRSASAIDRVTLIPAAGNFATGSRVALYGMGGI